MQPLHDTHVHHLRTLITNWVGEVGRVAYSVWDTKHPTYKTVDNHFTLGCLLHKPKGVNYLSNNVTLLKPLHVHSFLGRRRTTKDKQSTEGFFMLQKSFMGPEPGESWEMRYRMNRAFP